MIASGFRIVSPLHPHCETQALLIHYRDPLFTAEFLSMLAEVGVKSVKLPPTPGGM